MSRTYRIPVASAVLLLAALLGSVLFLLADGRSPGIEPAGGNGAAGEVASRPPASASEGSTVPVPPDVAVATAERCVVDPVDRAVISGRVIDVDTRNPVPGVEVRWTDIPPHIDLIDGMKRTLIARTRDIKRQYDRELFGTVAGRQPVLSDGAGCFSLTDVTSRTVYLYASGGPYFQHAIPRVATASGEHVAGVELPVRVGGRVVGRVFDPAGTPIEGAEVNLFYPMSPLSIFTLESRGTRKVQTASGADGSYRLPAVAAGSGYFLYVITAGRARVMRKGIAVERGSDTRVDVVVPAGGVITGRVSGERGEPVMGAEVRPLLLGKVFDMLFEGDVGTYDATTDGDGRYRVAGLPAGEHRVFVMAAGFAPAYRSGVRVQDSMVTPRVDFVLEEGAFLAGRVVDAQGRPVAGVLLRAGGGRPLSPGDPAAAFSASGRGVEVPQVDYPLGMTPDRMTEDQRERFRAEFLKSLGMLKTGTDEGDGGPLRERPFDGQDYTYLVQRFQDTSAADGSFLIGGLPQDQALWMWVHHERYSDRVIRGAVPGTDDLEIVLEELGGFSGIVLSGASGEPLERFTVFARNLMGFDEVEIECEPEDGQFELDSLNPGPYRFTVTADAHEKHADGQVMVVAGAVRRGHIILLRPGARVRGTVVNAADGSPVEGARIVPRREEGPFFENLMPRFRASTFSAVDGGFEVVGLGAGDQWLTASHPRLVTTVVELPGLEAGEVRDGVVIRMPAGGTIVGRALGPGDTPVAGLDVMVQSKDRTVFRQVVTGLDGSFRVAGLAAGTYLVMRLDLDLSDGDVYAMFPRILNGLRPVTTVVEDARTAHVTLRVGGEQDGVLLEGLVLDRSAPVAGAFVTLIRVDGGTAGVGGLRSDRSDATGRYRIVGVEPGSYVARVSGPPVQPGDVRIGLTVPAAERAEINLCVPGAEIDGRVVALDTGLPLSGVRLYLDAVPLGAACGSLRFGEALTGADGRFRFRRLAPGDYAVVARGLSVAGATLGGARRDGISLGPDQVKDVGDIVLGPGGTIRGVVVDQDGQPVERAALFFRAVDGLAMSISDTLTNYDGTFARPGLVPGAYRVHARALGYSNAAVDAVVADGVVTEVVLNLGHGASLRVAVVDGAGRPVDGAVVEVRNASGDVVSDLASPVDLVGGYLAGSTGPGIAIVTGLAVGAHTVCVRKAGFQPVTRRVMVEGDPTAVTVELGP